MTEIFTMKVASKQPVQSSMAEDVAPTAAIKRGRPPKTKPADHDEYLDLLVSVGTNTNNVSGKEEEKVIPKRRGRPPKTVATPDANTDTSQVDPKENVEVLVTPKRRGRPPKTVATPDANTDTSQVDPKENVEVLVTPKRRGRPPKAIATPDANANTSMNDSQDSDQSLSDISLIGKVAAISLRDESTTQWNASPDVYYPPEFTHQTVTQMALYDESANTFTWAKTVFSADEWRTQCRTWEIRYPNIVRNKRSTHETLAYRGQQTTNTDNIQYCWEALPQTHPDIASKFRDRFRVDMYGNVVSNIASDGALCKFDVDHLFPWSRGGRSVRANFAAVQCDANRRVKSDTMIPCLSPREMNCGLTAKQFKGLMELAVIKGGGRGQRRDVKYEEERVIQWLVHGPRKGYALSNFQALVNYTEDIEVLWQFFEQHEAMERSGGDRTTINMSPVKKEPSVSTVTPPTPAAAPVAAPPKTPQSPIVYVHITNDDVAAHRIDCYGPATYQLRDVLKGQLRMSFDDNADRKCWFKLFTSKVKEKREKDSEQFLQTLQDIIVTHGCVVSIT